MEFKDNEPIYIQIANYIGDQIMIGKWNKEEKILSVRELAVFLEVNPNTVMRAYEYLENLGVIYNKRGIGFFVELEGLNRWLERKKEIFLKEELPEFYKKLLFLNLDYSQFEDGFKELKNKDLKN